MAPTDITSTIASILASYENAREVLKRVCASLRLGKNAKKLKAAIVPDRKRLAQSLSLGKKEIGQEYSRGVGKHGKRFAEGDGRAQASLAATLLKLNTGLVDIISRFLHGGRAGMEPDYASLTMISDSSRAETKQALGGLHGRLTQHKFASSMKRPAIDQATPVQRKAPLPNTKARPRTKRPAKERSWALVRRKPKKQVLQARSSPNLLSTAANKDQTARGKGSYEPANQQIVQPKRPAPTPSTRPLPGRTNTGPQVARKPVKSAHLRSASAPLIMPQGSANLTTSATAPPPRPPKIPLNRPPIPTSQPSRAAIPSFYSTTTASTKFGEIPMDKWTVPFDFDEMSRINAAAAAEQGSIVPATRGRKGSGLLGRMFRRNKHEVELDV